MMEEGRLQLWHPVSLYLPEYADLHVRTKTGVRPVRNRLTLYHLITHTAGLSYGFLTDGGGLAVYQTRELHAAGLDDVHLSAYFAFAKQHVSGIELSLLRHHRAEHSRGRPAV